MQILGYISGVLSALCFLPYIRDILLHKTKPERASWLIWTTLGAIAFFSQLAKGATDSLWMPGVQTFGVFIIFLFSIKYGVGGLAKKDILSLIFAFFGLITWFLTKEPALALFIIIAVDATGTILTATKAYEDPGSETISTWILASLSGLFSAFSVGSLNLTLLAYPLYICLANLSIIAAMLLGTKKKK